MNAATRPGWISSLLVLGVAIAGGVGLYVGFRGDGGDPRGEAASQPAPSAQEQPSVRDQLAALEAARGGRVTPFDGPIPGRIVLIHRETVAESELPRVVSGSGVETQVQSFTSMAALKAPLGSDTVAIVIHESAVDDVDWEWVQRRFDEGRIIIGANINMGELLRLLSPASASVTGPDGLGWEAGEKGHYSPDRKFFSLILGGAARCSKGTTHEWDEGFSSAVDAAIRAAFACVPAQFEID